MPSYVLLTDVMVQGTPRSFGEVLDLSLGEGQLLVGLGRAKLAAAPSDDDSPEVTSEDEVPEPASDDVEPPSEAPIKPVVRRRTTSTSSSV